MPTSKSPRSKLPTVVGQPYGGGFYAGRFIDGVQAYLLIVAPKATGEKALPWGATGKTVKGALSYSDGSTNTAAMAKAGSALAKWARALKIGGSKDWYIPSRLEALVMFGELRALPAFEPEQPEAIERNWYWTSTQYAGDESSAWSQFFYDGDQDIHHKSNELRARAVRRIAI